MLPMHNLQVLYHEANQALLREHFMIDVPSLVRKAMRCQMSRIPVCSVYALGVKKGRLLASPEIAMLELENGLHSCIYCAHKLC